MNFVLFATVLALIEEAITTTMTNLAPVFGVEIGQSYITASTNYLDVVLGHSVIVFVPMFIAWAWLLSWYDFRPATVMLLFGLTGTLAEAGTFGLQHLAEVGLWVFVYGLMVYLPAYSVPAERGAKQLRLHHYVLAIFFALSLRRTRSNSRRIFSPSENPLSPISSCAQSQGKYFNFW